MPDLAHLIQQGQANLWLFIPSAVLLGALHGLEPGHSKTMMAAFIVAVRGTARQAALLGLSAALSHTAVVWIVALGGLWLGRRFDAHATEGWFQLASAAVMALVALWMAWRTAEGAAAHRHDPHPHDHRHDHDHAHHHDHDHGHRHDHGPGHRHHEGPVAESALAAVHLEADDAHARAHAEDIRRRFAGRQVTTGQIVLFGLTGGLIPCPASITVLLICLQLKKIALGAVLVAGFSVGLALTLVSVGVAAAVGLKGASRRFGPALEAFAASAPYASAAIILALAGLMAAQGLAALRQG